MCAQFDLKILANLLSLKYGFQVPEDFSFDQRVMPHSQAPVITSRGFQMMKFSLLPSWSKEPKVKFATHNVRLETIDEKATWRGPFKNNHCLVPITQFIEPIYINEFAGNMVSFSEVKNNLLTAAGIFDTWIDKSTGEVIESFSIITTEPSNFIASIGHDRSPLFLQDSSFLEWLNPKKTDAKQFKEFLLKNQQHPEFKVQKDRPMRSGWEKRK